MRDREITELQETGKVRLTTMGIGLTLAELMALVDQLAVSPNKVKVTAWLGSIELTCEEEEDA